MSARIRRNQHRAGLRTAHDRLSRDQFFAGLQLPHLLADAGFAGARGSLSRRSPGTICSKIAAACSISAFSTASGTAPRTLQHEDQPTDKQARRIPDQRARSGKARRSHAQDQGQRPRTTRKAKNTRAGHDGTARQRPAGRSARPRQADVRHHRHRLPDRQNPRRLAHHQPAIFRPCTIRSSM